MLEDFLLGRQQGIRSKKVAEGNNPSTLSHLRTTKSWTSLLCERATVVTPMDSGVRFLLVEFRLIGMKDANLKLPPRVSDVSYLKKVRFGFSPERYLGV